MSAGQLLAQRQEQSGTGAQSFTGKEEVLARRIVLKDSKGRVRATLGIQEGSSESPVVFALLSETGDTQLSLRSEARGASVEIGSEKLGGSINLHVGEGLGPDHDATIDLLSKSGQRVRINAAKATGSLALFRSETILVDGKEVPTTETFFRVPE
jgi:hypothetical protein